METFEKKFDRKNIDEKRFGIEEKSCAKVVKLNLKDRFKIVRYYIGSESDLMEKGNKSNQSDEKKSQFNGRRKSLQQKREKNEECDQKVRKKSRKMRKESNSLNEGESIFLTPRVHTPE